MHTPRHATKNHTPPANQPEACTTHSPTHPPASRNQPTTQGGTARCSRPLSRSQTTTPHPTPTPRTDADPGPGGAEAPSSRLIPQNPNSVSADPTTPASRCSTREDGLGLFPHSVNTTMPGHERPRSGVCSLERR